MIRAFAPYIAILLLVVLSWGLWQKSKAAGMEADSLRAANRSLSKAAAELAAQRTRDNEAIGARDARIGELEAALSLQRQTLRGIDDACMATPLPDPVRRLFEPAGKSAHGVHQSP